MSVVLGYQQTSFVTKDTKETINGCNIWIGEPITKDGNGHKVERFFLSQRILQQEDFAPIVGDEVEVMFNRYGKVASIRVV